MAENFCPAKRGDLALFQVESSTTYVHGRTERVHSYLFAVVRSVTLGGNIKRAQRPENMPWPWWLGGGKSWVVPRDKLNGETPDDVLGNLPGPYPTMEAARDAIRAAIPPAP